MNPQNQTLAHEKEGEKYVNRTTDNYWLFADFEDPEEKRVILDKENVVAKEMGYEPRYKHNGFYMPTKSPIVNPKIQGLK